MKFGFDIDDTLIDLRQHAFHIYNKKLNKNIPIEAYNELKTVEIHEPFGLTAEEGSKMWKSNLEETYFTTCPPFPYAVETLQELEKQGHEIYYVTARNKEYGERTKEWLKKNGFPVHQNRFYCGMKDSEKIHIIKELGLDYYFDDKPEILNTLSELTLKVYVKDTSYNRGLDIPRITCWSELKEIIESNY
ncbi:5' nucleotidase, NT5C type [Gottfriedia acidiceleris]|uniref:5' nucleotidase, NT5C type n=1 Tax=Gottfriedia acidiceleris TaxID=371036 RepID=UPI000B43C3E5|nr:HAD family acid phosphatase [Gottfriedia acidiceleris]